MYEHLDLAAMAEAIDQPFSPRVAVTQPPLGVVVLVCEAPRRWNREAAYGELWLVLEGVLTLDGTFGHLVVNEGEVAHIPAKVAHTVFSGMRTTVVVLRRLPQTAQENGHYTPPIAGQMKKQNLGVVVHHAAPFDWLDAGTVAGWGAHATRLTGMSTPYEVPEGGIILVVYRGVLDWRMGDEEGAVVGSQLLQVEPPSQLTLSSDRGATVVLLAREGALLPESATVPGTAGA